MQKKGSKIDILLRVSKIAPCSGNIDLKVTKTIFILPIITKVTRWPIGEVLMLADNTLVGRRARVLAAKKRDM